MVAIDNSHELAPVRGETAHTGQILLFAMLISALLAVASLTVDLGAGTGWRAAAEMVSRFSLLLFIATMVVEPLGRLIPIRAFKAAAQERASLTMGFIATTVISLACVVAPMQLGTESLAATTVAYCAFTAAILLVMLFSGHPATLRFLGAPAWRAMQRIATAYFWVAFLLTGLEHLVGPHRPDSWPGISLLLLVAAVLVRFADAFLAHYRGVAEKVG